MQKTFFNQEPRGTEISVNEPNTEATIKNKIIYTINITSYFNNPPKYLMLNMHNYVNKKKILFYFFSPEPKRVQIYDLQNAKVVNFSQAPS